jgi:hypothetical protein
MDLKAYKECKDPEHKVFKAYKDLEHKAYKVPMDFKVFKEHQGAEEQIKH